MGERKNKQLELYLEYLQTPEGRKKIREYLSSPDGKKALRMATIEGERVFNSFREAYWHESELAYRSMDI